ncbi:MAG TPA: HEPN domain-containing protein [Bryobacteraceae bacterium]|nr:HEPN domain-containing protein [Bryobacteraceae bacterium]
MKGKADLVQGWLRKAASDLLAMRASAQAGALDAACFHAQRAAEKYLKAYLTDRGREIIHTHNLFKLVNAYAEIDPTFGQLMDEAALLTPFAVEARYDTEFWPTMAVMEEAELAVNRVASLVCSQVQAVTTRPDVYSTWQAARRKFNWSVDLRKFKDAAKYPGFFDRVIPPEQIEQFEADFRAGLVPRGKVERAAEIVYWKNGGNFRARDRITRDLFIWIDGPQDWLKFVDALKNLAATPTWECFKNLITACGLTSGFATPLTFLSFYDPKRFPMVDQRIGKWWLRRFPDNPQFAWNPDTTVIAQNKKSWEAYIAWTEFCRRQAAGLSWRARDVEMAVWSDRDAQLPLDE